MDLLSEKKELKKNSSGGIRSRCIDCEYSRKASQLAIDDGDGELKDSLNRYIKKRTKIREEHVMNKDVRSAEMVGKIVFESNGLQTRLKSR